jgi:hypothetical protein
VAHANVAYIVHKEIIKRLLNRQVGYRDLPRGPFPKVLNWRELNVLRTKLGLVWRAWIEEHKDWV